MHRTKTDWEKLYKLVNTGLSVREAANQLGIKRYSYFSQWKRIHKTKKQEFIPIKMPTKLTCLIGSAPEISEFLRLQ